MCILHQNTKHYFKVFFRYWEWKVIKVGGTISYCVSYLRNVPLSTRPPPDYNYNSTLLSSVLLNCTFILFLVLSNVWDSAGGRNTKSYFSACSKNNIYFAAQCKCATCLRSVPECNIYLQRVEQCILWLVRAARVPVPQLLQGQDLLLEGVLEHEVHEGVGHLNSTTSVNIKNRAVNKISHDFTIFRGHSLLKALWIVKKQRSLLLYNN